MRRQLPFGIIQASCLMVCNVSARAKLPLKEAAIVHHQHMGMFQWPRCQYDGDCIHGSQQNGHHQSKYPKRRLFYSREVFALYNQQYLIHKHPRFTNRPPAKLIKRVHGRPFVALFCMCYCVNKYSIQIATRMLRLDVGQGTR